MGDFAGFASGATGGALAGNEMGGPVGAVIGGVAGGVASLFGPSRESIQRGRYNEAMKFISELRASNVERRKKTIDSGITQLNRFNTGLISSVRSGAGARAASIGRSGDVESFVLPAEARAASIGNRGISSFVGGVNAHFNAVDEGLDKSALDTTMAFQGRPIDPSVGETIGGIGTSVAGYMQANRYIASLKGADLPSGDGSQSVFSIFNGSRSTTNHLAHPME